VIVMPRPEGFLQNLADIDYSNIPTGPELPWAIACNDLPGFARISSPRFVG
jgi:hypothetical protein